jgi:hypothetical protein
MSDAFRTIPSHKVRTTESAGGLVLDFLIGVRLLSGN